MDTNDLSREVYNAIIEEAEKLNRDLSLEFSLLFNSCENEEAYLLAAKELIDEWKANLGAAFLDIFYGDILPEQSSFEETILKIESNILEVEKIPFENRKYNFWEEFL